MAFMKFPKLASTGDYRDLLEKNHCQVEVADDTRLFAPYLDLSRQMLDMQLGYDALKLIGFDLAVMQGMAGEMLFLQNLQIEFQACKKPFGAGIRSPRGDGARRLWVRDKG